MRLCPSWEPRVRGKCSTRNTKRKGSPQTFVRAGRRRASERRSAHPLRRAKAQSVGHTSLTKKFVLGVATTGTGKSACASKGGPLQKAALKKHNELRSRSRTAAYTH